MSTGITRIAAALLIAATLIPPISPRAEESDGSSADRLVTTIEEEGVEAGIYLLSELNEAQPDDATLQLDSLMTRSVKEFTSGRREIGIGLMNVARHFFPDDVRVHSVLGQLYWYTEDRAQCIESFRHTLELDLAHETAKRYWDLLFFVPEDFTPPAELLTEHLRVRPLCASDVDLDYRAVMSSIEHLRGVFGPDNDWPSEELTREEDLRALQNHEKEHARRCAFTYTVMNHDETECLGCVYILPVHSEDFDAQVYFWVTADAFRRGLEEELASAVKGWIGEKWPFSSVAYPGRDIDWESWERFDD